MSEQLTCPACSSYDLELITDTLRFGKKANVHQCTRCNLKFLDQKSFKFPADFYEKEYHQTYLTHVEPEALNPQVYYEKMKKTTKIWADMFREMLTGNEAVLDVGCSTGHFIDLVKDKTTKIYGSELNKKEVEFCRNHLSLDVSDSALEKRFKPGTFDYITMIFVLEHIALPKDFLSMLKKLLKPTGKLVILVPNAKDALVNFYDIPEYTAFYYCIEHLFYYSPQTIKNLFDDVGLVGRIETIQEYPITNHLNWAYKHAPSDVLASRKSIPAVGLRPSSPEDQWVSFWEETNVRYKEFLKQNGYGDRIWAVVGNG